MGKLTEKAKAAAARKIKEVGEKAARKTLGNEVVDAVVKAKTYLNGESEEKTYERGGNTFRKARHFGSRKSGDKCRACGGRIGVSCICGGDD